MIRSMPVFLDGRQSTLAVAAMHSCAKPWQIREDRMSSISTSQRPTNVRWVVLALACLTSGMLYVHRYSWGVIKKEIKQEFEAYRLATRLARFHVSGGLHRLSDSYRHGRRSLRTCSRVAADGSRLVVRRRRHGFGTRLLLVRDGQAAVWRNAGRRLSEPDQDHAQLVSAGRTNYRARSGWRDGRPDRRRLCAAADRVGADVSNATRMRAALIAIAVLGVLLAAALRTVLRDSPNVHPGANAAERELIGDYDPPKSQPPEIAVGRAPRAVKASLALMMLQSFTSTFADILFVYWIPLFLEEEKGLSKGAMGVFASLPLMAGALGGAAGGMLNDLIIRRTGKLRLGRTAVGLSGKLTAAFLIAASLSVEDGRWMMVVVAAAKFFTDWSLPTLWGAVTDIGGRAVGQGVRHGQHHRRSGRLSCRPCNRRRQTRLRLVDCLLADCRRLRRLGALLAGHRSDSQTGRSCFRLRGVGLGQKLLADRVLPQLVRVAFNA